ncbi:MAG: hypothetical protein K8J31_28030, partial [Anaerolineae bacterium]|nr:hypothetical protein [Anaerolineae bacterium]
FIDFGFPFEPKHNTLLVFLVVAVPTLALAFWARPGPLPRGSMLREIGHFVIPAALTIYAFGMLVYVMAIFATVLGTVDVAVTPDMVAEFRTFTGINYDISAPNDFIREVAFLAAQTVLTSFLVYSGLILVIFVEPPAQWFVGGDEWSGDWRPTLLAGALLLVYIVILLIDPLRSFFELLNLPLSWHLLIAAAALVWMLFLRLVWRRNWLKRFFGSAKA